MYDVQAEGGGGSRNNPNLRTNSTDFADREGERDNKKSCGRQIWKSSCPPLSLAARTHMSIYSHIPEGSARTIKRGKERPLAKNMIIPVFAATAHFSHMALSLRELQRDPSG